MSASHHTIGDVRLSEEEGHAFQRVLEDAKSPDPRDRYPIHPRTTCTLYLKSSSGYFHPFGSPEPGILVSIICRSAESSLFPERMVLENARFKTCIGTLRVSLKVPSIWITATPMYVELLICSVEGRLRQQIKQHVHLLMLGRSWLRLF